MNVTPKLLIFAAMFTLATSGGAVAAQEAKEQSGAAGEANYAKLPFKLDVEQMGDQPVYYALGFSGVPDSSNAGHTSNAGFVVTDEGVVVYDALGTPALGWALLQAIRERTDKPVKYVVVSHYHADHIYGLQAFDQHTDAKIIAQQETLEYLNEEKYATSEQAQSRLEQRREALWPWVDENTYLIEPDETFAKEHQFSLGGKTFKVTHLGPAHAPGDAIMVVPELGVVFSGDVIYTGRVPFLDSPHVSTSNWLDGLQQLLELDVDIKRVVPGHGKSYEDMKQAVTFTRDYIRFLREKMGEAVDNFTPFAQAYGNVDWSEYEDMPAFEASNRGNAYRVYLEMESNSFTK